MWEQTDAREVTLPTEDRQTSSYMQCIHVNTSIYTDDIHNNALEEGKLSIRFDQVLQ